MGQVRDQGRSARDTRGVATSAGILVRVSSDGQDEANQVPELEDYCYDQNYRINKRYNVHDRSAYHGEHEAWLDEALDDIRTGVISVLVIVHSSRLDRRDPDVAEFYHLSIRQAGGRIESVREPMFGKSDISGRVVTMLAQDANHSYSRTLSGHVRASHNRIRTNRATGKGLLGRAPFGYEIQGDKYSKILVPTPLGRKYIPEMFDRIICGESLATVAAWLNSENVPTGTTKGRDRNHVAVPGKTPVWTASTVNQIIRNSVYKGQMRDSDHDFVGTCEAIVSVSAFEQAGKRLDAKPKRGPQNNANRAMLTSVLFCECGSPMYRVKTGAAFPYYRCAGKVTGKSCIMLRMSTVDNAVDAILSSNPEPIMKMTLVEGRNYDGEIDLIKAQIKALDIDAPDYDERYAALMAERARLKDLDTTPDTWALRPTGQTWGGLWDGLESAERSRWLARQGFSIQATRMAVTVSQGERSAAITLGQ
jgi:DNA invertase Pin-like site-specific DNA recombinase